MSFRITHIIPVVKRLCLPWTSAGVILMAVAGMSCNESLPDYHSPGNVLSVRVVSYEQLNDHIAPPTRPFVHVVVMAENVHDEVFWDSVNVHGTMTIWWKRKPTRSRTMTLTEANFTDRSIIHNGKLLLTPGQKFFLDAYWDMKTDAGLFLPSEMDWSNPNEKYCAANVYCAPPEIFVVEVALNVYDRLGVVAAPVDDITIIGRACALLGYPPCN